jgi:hypothetical protein
MRSGARTTAANRRAPSLSRPRHVMRIGHIDQRPFRAGRERRSCVRWSAAGAPAGFAEQAQSVLAHLGATPSELSSAIDLARDLLADPTNVCRPSGDRSPYADRCGAQPVRHLDPREVRLMGASVSARRVVGAHAILR